MTASGLVRAGLRVAVVIPAFNEEAAIARVVRAVPEGIDDVIVIDDASHDDTYRSALNAACSRVTVVRHEANRGVGAAIVTGYRRAMALGADCAVVMAGDGQMDPADLEQLIAPIATGQADYVKGNRFAHREVWKVMPRHRLLGNVALSLATRLVSGYWHVWDSQCGYTAITREALTALHLDQVFSRYGYPNDLLARLHTVGARVVDVPVKPIYGEAWKSGIRWSTVLHPMTSVLVRAWGRRLWAETLGRAKVRRLGASRPPASLSD